MLRWAILGTGFISGTVVESISISEGSQVEIVSGRNPERLATFQKQHGIARGVVNYEEAVADPNVDAVYIGLPNHMHHQPAIAAAAAGKAVLSEKSLTTTMASADALIDGVRANGTFFVEGLMYLAHPMYQRVVELLLDGRLGRVRSISGRYAANIWQVVNPRGMGTIYNLGCYPVSLLQLVMTTVYGPEQFEDRSMTAVGNLTYPEDQTDGDDTGTVGDAAMAVRFGNGVLATIQSTDNFGNHSDFVIVGDRGTLRFDTNPWLPEAGENVLTWTPFVDDGSGPATERIVTEDPYDAFYHQIKLVERCVAEGALEAPRPSPTLDDSRQIMAMLTEWEQRCRADDGQFGQI